MNIVAIKCVTGELIMAKEEETSALSTLVGNSFEPRLKKYTDLRTIGLIRDQQGDLRIQCGPWIYFDAQRELLESEWEKMTLVSFKPDDNLTRVYLQSTSRIQLGA